MLSVSLGSSTRDHEARISLRGEEWVVARLGSDGDMAKCRATYLEEEQTVAAFGMGGIDRWLWVGERRYEFRDAARLVAGIKKPVADGSGQKRHLERALVARLLAAGEILSPRDSVLMVSGLDRWGMATAFAEAGCDVLYGDLIFGLGMPVAIRSLPALGKVGRALLPAITKLPFKWLYPTGSAQEESSGRHGKWFAGRRVVAGDFHYIRRHAPPDLSGVVVVTNTTTEDDVRMLRERGVEWLVTTTPRLEGRSFGANVMEALFFALEGRTDLRGEDYHRLAAEFGFGGSVERLQ
ncbi:quinate 5-dehydrogenase [bacterium]|nr:quinate 5-dehydrogenase [bacterium]